jgi:Flp pilus assembly protein TadD
VEQEAAGVDTSSYVQLAREVLGGNVALGPGLYYLSPLYVYFLAFVLRVSDSFTVARALQAALGTVAVGCLFLTTREWFGPRAAWMSAGLAALTGLFTFYEVLLLQASLDTFLTAAALTCLTFALTRDNGSRRGWPLLAGFVFAVDGLNRPNMLLAVAGVVMALLLARHVRVSVWVAAGLLVGLAPVVIRNVVVSHQAALASSQGGLNFYIGNHASATGQYVEVPGVRANVEGQAEDTRRVAETALGRSLSDAQVSDYFTGLALSWIRGHAADAAALFARKMALVFNARHQWLDFSYPYYAWDLDTVLKGLIVGPWLIIPLGLAGLVVAWPDGRRTEYLAWASFVPWYGIAVAVFFVAERYRLPLLVALCIPAGAAVDRIIRAFATGQWRSLMVVASVLVPAAVVASWTFQLNDGRFDERLRLAKALMNKAQYAEAVTELTQALQIDPAHTVAEFTLGIALVSDGRAGEGIPHIRHAVDAGVPIPGARYVLVRAMHAAGDDAGAARLLRTLYPDRAEDADSCFQVGLLALDVDTPDVAERYLRQAIAQRPKWGIARQRLGVALIAEGRHGEAASELRSAIDLGAAGPVSYANLAYCEAMLGHIAEAQRLAQITLQLDPGYDMTPLQALFGRDRVK